MNHAWGRDVRSTLLEALLESLIGLLADLRGQEPEDFGITIN